MAKRRPVLVRRATWAVAAVLAFLGLAAFLARAEIQRALLDPGVPYQVYNPPPAPNYAAASAWALLPAAPGRPAEASGLDIFFVHPTTYDGGRDWNAPIGEPKANGLLFRVMIPNYAGPFQALGRVFAPRYRQASLYSLSTLRDDAREARRFALVDVEAALQTYLARWNGGRPLIVVGVGQGGLLASRAVEDATRRDPALRSRLVAVYLIDVIVPADAYGASSPLPACDRRAQSGCVVAWDEAPRGGEAKARQALDRSLVWNDAGQLELLRNRPALCVDPVSGGLNGRSGERAHLGAANASGLEWGARPAFLPRQVSTECRAGLLYVSPPSSPSLKRPGDWKAQLRVTPFNLFYADLEADARARLAAFRGGAPAPPIHDSIAVQRAPIHRID